jgi:hypothetical protein
VRAAVRSLGTETDATPLAVRAIQIHEEFMA